MLASFKAEADLSVTDAFRWTLPARQLQHGKSSAMVTTALDSPKVFNSHFPSILPRMQVSLSNASVRRHKLLDLTAIFSCSSLVVEASFDQFVLRWHSCFTVFFGIALTAMAAGGLFLRAVAERCDGGPRMHTLVSLGSPHQGYSNTPSKASPRLAFIPLFAFAEG